MPIRSKYLNGHTNELFSGKAELSLPRSFPAKAFKYLNRRANEFLGGKSSWKFHFLEVRVVFILSVLAGFSIFWSGSTSWILFSVLRQTLFPRERHGGLLRQVFLFKNNRK